MSHIATVRPMFHLKSEVYQSLGALFQGLGDEAFPQEQSHRKWHSFIDVAKKESVDLREHFITDRFNHNPPKRHREAFLLAARQNQKQPSMDDQEVLKEAALSHHCHPVRGSSQGCFPPERREWPPQAMAKKGLHGKSIPPCTASERQDTVDLAGSIFKNGRKAGNNEPARNLLCKHRTLCEQSCAFS